MGMMFFYAKRSLNMLKDSTPYLGQEEGVQQVCDLLKKRIVCDAEKRDQKDLQIKKQTPPK